MKFKERLQKVLQALGLIDKAKKNELTADDWKNIEASYKKEHGSDLYDDMKESKEQAEKAKAHDEALQLIAEDQETTASEETETEAGGEGGASTEKSEGKTKVDLVSEFRKMKEENSTLKNDLKDQKERVEELSRTVEEDKPKTDRMTVKGFAREHTDKYAFGIEHDIFSTGKRWNRIAVNPKEALVGSPSEDDEKAFKQEVNSFGKSLAARYAHLKKNNRLDPEKLMAGTELDVTEVGDQLGNYYVIRRQDALIAQILTIRTVYDFFPRRYGIQDQEVINNALFEEVSQAWQAGKIFKGSAEIQPETGHVDDASIKLKFEPLVKLERNFLGYLNTEGSDPIKWGMIEWYSLNILKKSVEEQTKRRVLGCYVKPETGTPGKAINSSTGLIYTLIRYIHQNKLNPIDNSAYASYTSSNMYDTVKAYLDVWADLLEDQEMDEYTLVLNERHKPWWLTNIRAKFGTHSDFAGPKSNVFPDYNIPIYWCPGMKKHTFMILTKPGNLQALEYLPGEMLALKFETDFEDVLVRSRWKEGFSSAFVGPKFSSKALLEANSYLNQHIFMNKPVTVIDPDANTIDGSANFWFVTSANTVATAVSALPTGGKPGQVYFLECGSTTNATTISKAGNYAGITANWTPVAVGDYIMFTLNAAGDGVRELERCVNGVRTVNAAVQPTLPEART